MINMHTKCEVSSLSRSRDILRGIKVGYVTWLRPFVGRFVIHRLERAHFKFEMSNNTCNDEMKGNALLG